MNTVEAIKENLFMDLESLKTEILDYPDEADLWKVLPGTINSAGVIFVHVTRSLRHFVGSAFANTGYLRQRDEEFKVRDIPRKDMLEEFELMKTELNTAFENVDPNKLDEDFPLPWRGGGHYPTHFMLTRMLSHVNFHLGQVNYHRRFFRN